MAGGAFVQYGFRLRNDDGNEATATWIDVQNANATIVANTNFRIRFSISGAATTTTMVLMVSKNGGAYVAIGATAPANSASSPYVSDNTDTTNQMTNAYAFQNGGKVDTSNANPSVSHLASRSYEYEWCIKINPVYIANGDILTFRVYGGGAFSGTTPYPQTPSITVSYTPLDAGTISSDNIGETTAELTEVTAPSGGTAPYTYKWYKKIGPTVTIQAVNLIAGATLSTYSATGLLASTQYTFARLVTDAVPVSAYSTTTFTTGSSATPPPLIETDISVNKPYRTNEEPNALYKMRGIHHRLFRDVGA